MIRINSCNAFIEKGVRPNNEDYIAPLSPSNFERIYVVCDGMGGHGHGEVASRVVANGLYERLANVPLEMIDEKFLQRTLLQLQKEDLNPANIDDGEKKMGTTVVLAVIQNDQVLVAHIGDSRLYHIREGKCLFRTIDHSVTEEAVQAHILTEEEAREHPSKNILTHCLQPFPDSAPAFEVDKLTDIQEGDLLVLSTDGVTDALTTEQLGQICENFPSSAQIAMELQKQCQQLSHDNYSGFVVELGVFKLPQLETLEEPKIEEPAEQTPPSKPLTTTERPIILQYLKKYGLLILVVMLLMMVSFLLGRSCQLNHRGIYSIKENPQTEQSAPIETQE